MTGKNNWKNSLERANAMQKIRSNRLNLFLTTDFKKDKKALQEIAKDTSNILLKQGIITKKKFCQFCGIKNKKLILHHSDYSQPEEVLTLCQRCHLLVHQLFNKEIKKQHEEKISSVSFASASCTCKNNQFDYSIILKKWICLKCNKEYNSIKELNWRRS